MRLDFVTTIPCRGRAVGPSECTELGSPRDAACTPSAMKSVPPGARPGAGVAKAPGGRASTPRMPIARRRTDVALPRVPIELGPARADRRPTALALDACQDPTSSRPWGPDDSRHPENPLAFLDVPGRLANALLTKPVCSGRNATDQGSTSQHKGPDQAVSPETERTGPDSLRRV